METHGPRSVFCPGTWWTCVRRHGGHFPHDMERQHAGALCHGTKTPFQCNVSNSFSSPVNLIPTSVTSLVAFPSVLRRLTNGSSASNATAWRDSPIAPADRSTHLLRPARRPNCSCSTFTIVSPAGVRESCNVSCVTKAHRAISRPLAPSLLSSNVTLAACSLTPHLKLPINASLTRLPTSSGKWILKATSLSRAAGAASPSPFSTITPASPWFCALVPQSIAPRFSPLSKAPSSATAFPIESCAIMLLLGLAPIRAPASLRWASGFCARESISLMAGLITPKPKVNANASIGPSKSNCLTALLLGAASLIAKPSLISGATSTTNCVLIKPWRWRHRPAVISLVPAPCRPLFPPSNTSQETSFAASKPKAKSLSKTTSSPSGRPFVDSLSPCAPWLRMAFSPSSFPGNNSAPSTYVPPSNPSSATTPFSSLPNLQKLCPPCLRTPVHHVSSLYTLRRPRTAIHLANTGAR